ALHSVWAHRADGRGAGVRPGSRRGRPLPGVRPGPGAAGAWSRTRLAGPARPGLSASSRAGGSLSRPTGGALMDQAQARALLAGERARLQRLLQAEEGEPQADELGDEVDDADRRNAEETGTAVDHLLRARWAALRRAEARLAAGSYGRSVRSGEAIPDERVAGDPLAAATRKEGG